MTDVDPVGSFGTKESPLANRRDLGGIPVATGVVRSGIVYRSDDLSLSPREEVVELYNRGLSLVLDLRSPMEKDLRPHRYLDGLDVDYHALSFIDEAIDPQTAVRRMSEIATSADLGRWYAHMAEDAATVIAEGLDLVANTAGSSIFHCAAGKDRAGIFAASLLSVLGADDDEIVKDYARTDAVIGTVLARLTGADQEEQAHVVQQLNSGTIDSESPLLRAYEDAARVMLRVLEESHGGMLRLLQAAGLASATESRLRDRLIR